jgi:hypothetical protein
MRAFTAAHLAALRADALLAEVRVHLPFDHHLL